MAEQNPAVGLWAKMLRVMAAVERLPKSGYNSFHKYHYATESDVNEHIRKLLIQERIVFLPSAEGYERDGDLTRAPLLVRWIDADTGEMIETRWWGEGQDKGDKGIYKAYTGGLKYALMKTFLIPTGDDPENDEQAPRQQGQRQQQRPPKRQAPAKPTQETEQKQAKPDPAAPVDRERVHFAKIAAKTLQLKSGAVLEWAQANIRKVERIEELTNQEFDDVARWLHQLQKSETKSA